MKRILLLVFTAFIFIQSKAQNVGIGTNTPNASAQLDVSSNSKGILFPRVSTSERNGIANPATGLMVFDVEKNAPYFFNGTVWVPLAPISPKDMQPIEIATGVSPNIFGAPYSVAMSGNYAAAGMPYYDSAGAISIGAVQIFKKTNGVWRKSQLIIAPDTASHDQFGYTMDMQGSYLVIGAPYKSVLATSNSGKAYVYKLEDIRDGDFVLDGEITHPSGLLASSYFGFSVSITSRSPLTNGVAVAIGAPLYTSSGTIKGTVSIFRRSAANNYIHVNTISGYQDNEQFGISVDIDSNLVVMGAPFFDTTISTTNFSNTGRVQINRFNGTNYSTADAILKPTIDTSCYWGYRVTLDTNCIVMSGYNSFPAIHGAYPVIYRRISPGNYTKQNDLYEIISQFEPDVSGMMMGYNMAITHSFLILGISHEYHFTTSQGWYNSRNEYALIYKRSASGYLHTYYTQLKVPDKQTESRYGWAVAASGNNYIIAMPDGFTSNGNRGAVYFGTIVE